LCILKNDANRLGGPAWGAGGFGVKGGASGFGAERGGLKGGASGFSAGRVGVKAGASGFSGRGPELEVSDDVPDPTGIASIETMGNRKTSKKKFMSKQKVFVEYWLRVN